MKYVGIAIIIMFLSLGIFSYVHNKKNNTPMDSVVINQIPVTQTPQGVDVHSVSNTTAPIKTDKKNITKITKTNNGMTIEIIKEGTGDAITNGKVAIMKYTGSLSDGTVFDSTDKHGGEPFKFNLGAGEVIKGWDQGVLGMKVGEIRKLTIPSDLAYGPSGISGVIPGGATLMFTVELISFK